MGTKDFVFALEPGRSPENAVSFDLEKGQAMLRESYGVGIFNEKGGVCIDNQEFKDRNAVYPHAFLEITMLQPYSWNQWLILSRTFVESLGMEIGFVLGDNENVADYKQTPLRAGIGLIQVFWIMCFGPGYSALIPSAGAKTSFFKREDLPQSGCKVFVSTESYDDYCCASRELFESQKAEIGQGLFHRYKIQRMPAHGQSTWIFNPKTVWRFVSFLYREHSTNWRDYQAEILPSYYKE
jgi:hypothetical protein